MCRILVIAAFHFYDDFVFMHFVTHILSKVILKVIFRDASSFWGSASSQQCLRCQWYFKSLCFKFL